jgi:hypothetical protein
MQRVTRQPGFVLDVTTPLWNAWVVGAGGGKKRSNLVCDVGSCFGDVTVHLAHDADVLVAVEEGVLLLALDAHVAGPRV